MRVNRETLLHALESVEPGLSKKETIEQSNCFALHDGLVSAFNDETCCHAPSGLAKDFRGAVQADKVLTLLRKLSEDEIDLDAEDGQLIIKGKSRKAGIRMETEITLPIDKVEKPTKWTKLHEDFGEAIGIVYQCAGKDDSMFRLTCVHITPRWVEGCNNSEICRWKLPTGVSQPALVRKTAIKHVTTLGMVDFSETENWLHFRNPSGLVFSCRRYLEEYPSLSQFLKVEGQPMTLPKGLAEACDKADVFSSENTDNNFVTVELKAGRVKVRGQGVSGWYNEVKKVDYKGESLTFNVSPQLLMELVNRHNDCIISADRLKVNGGNYVYVANLHRPVEKVEKEGEKDGNGVN